MRNFLKFFLLPTLVIMAAFGACNKTDDIATTEEFVDQALYSVQERGGMGRFGCYELVFPVSFTLPDNTVVEADSYEDIKTALRTYFSNNSGSAGGHGNHGFARKINFAFPISVINENGEVITVENQEALHAIRLACAGTFGNHGHQGHGQHGLSCFEIVFPITLAFSDGTNAVVNSREEFHRAIRRWHTNNPGSTGRPQISFPITIKMTEDGSTVTVNSREELRTIKENCE